MNKNSSRIHDRNGLFRIENDRGSSLLEVLMAMVLVSVVVLGIAGFSTVSINGAAFSKEMTTAVTLAQDTLEDIRRVGYGSSVSRVRTDIEPYGSITDALLFERTVITEPNTPAMGLQTITVKVAWDADAHSTSFSTILAE